MNNEMHQISPQPTPTSKVGLIVTVAVILTALIVGFGVYAWQQSVQKKQIAALQQEMQTVATVQPVTTSPSATTPVATTPASTGVSNLKTYTNTGLGFSFQYPAGYTVTSDTLPPSPGPQTNPPTKNLTLINNSVPEKPTLTVYVNTDGFGPFFADVSYTLAKSGTSLTVAKRTVNTPTANSQDGDTMINSQPVTVGANTYLFHFTFKEGTQNYEEDLKAILASFSAK